MSAPDRDIDKLDPTFRERVDELLRRMRVHGHQPVVWETLRSFKRAEQLAAAGKGVAKSMHCYGLAVDIVDGYRATKEESLWTALPKFWADLEREVGELGLTWGGHFRRVDKPHVQAVPFADQGYVRRATPAQIALLVSERLEVSDPSHRDTVRESTRAKAKP